MAKIALILITIFAVVGAAVFIAHESPRPGTANKLIDAPKVQKESFGIHEAKITNKPEEQTVLMLYAAKNISEGSVIIREDIVVKETAPAKIPQGGLSKRDLESILGCKAKLPLVSGQMFANHDIDPPPWGRADPKH